jgi:hypothetical protein
LQLLIQIHGILKGNLMNSITTSPHREIIEDFAKLIALKKTQDSKPSKDVINFRDEKVNQVERDVCQVPVELLRYRKDNGRIASDVFDYERRNGILHEKDKTAQEILFGYLSAKDPEKTEDLMKSIEHTGQSEPAVITCDGFLINGNRRKMALETLTKRFPGKPEFQSMKVVILPGVGEPGGPPTLLEIEQLENRYQLQRDGKAEYYGFDQALTIKRKIAMGYTLEMQLLDDPKYVRATEKELKQAVEQITQEFLLPLDCIDRYLETFDRAGLYGTVSSGRGDREGRWQAFKDYSETYYTKFKNKKWMMENGIEEEEIGELEDSVFKIIRFRDLPAAGLKKLHQVMRELRRLSANKDSRKELMKISDEVEPTLPKAERVDAEGKPLSIEREDEKWAKINKQPIINHLKKAIDTQERDLQKETPVTLLEAALQKLSHDKMSVGSIGVGDFARARQLASDIQKRAKEIENELYDAKKNFESLARKK